MRQNHRKGLSHPGKINSERELPLHAGVLYIPVNPKHAGPLAHDKGRIDHGDIRGPKLACISLYKWTKKVTYLVDHTPNYTSLINIKFWFENFCLVEENE